ncbi:MAG: prenyltransferase/squalene oxidase repeat-containing protein, partial [Planctomycetota bacterium]
MNWINDSAEFFSTSNLPLFLLVGSGILAISLLILTLTRWGHSRPVWKCVILSVVAHVLLIGFASGTRLIFDQQPPEVAQSVPIKVHMEEDFAVYEEQEFSVETKPTWDQFASLPNETMPVVEPLAPMKANIDQLNETETIATEVDSGLDSIPIPAIENHPIDNQRAHKELALSGDEDFTHDTLIDETASAEKIEVTRRQSAADQDLGPSFESFEDSEPIQPIFESASRSLVDDPVDNDFLNPPITDIQSEFGEFSVPKTNQRENKTPSKLTQLTRLSSNRQSPNLRASKTQQVRRIADGQPLPKAYSLRLSKNRNLTAMQRGGSRESEEAVHRALLWLSQNQQSDGSWSSRLSGGGRETNVFGHNRGGAGANADCGITGLATLAFLGAGHSHLEGKFKTTVQRALEFLAQNQKSNGDLSGPARLFARMYCHSISLFALSESLAMTGDRRLLSVVQLGVDYSVNSQNQRDGGWRYQPGDAGDMSQFGWQVLALNSARLGGASIPDETFIQMERFLELCCRGPANGLASYKPNEGPSTTMTAEALLCRYVLMKSPSIHTIETAQKRILSDLPQPKIVNLYYWYYGTLAMYQAGGSSWDQWNQNLLGTLLPLQNKTGPDLGSWPANGIWGGYGGKVYATAMATMSLEVYYRYLPIREEIAEQ